MSYTPSSSSYTAVVGPRSTTNTLGSNMVFAGLNTTITPKATGKLFVIITGTCSNGIAGNGIRTRGKYGTGTPPSLGDLESGVGTNFDGSTGTSNNIIVTRVRVANDRYDFIAAATISGLTIGTAYWIDMAFNAVTGDTASLYNMTVSVVESTTNKELENVNITCTDPSGTSSTGLGVMMGLGSQVMITPKVTGKVLVIATGSYDNDLEENGVVYLSRGTGTPPSNGDALTGTSFGGVHPMPLNQAGASRYPWTLSAIVSGLTVGTEYWFDLIMNSSAGGTSHLFDITITLIEIY